MENKVININPEILGGTPVFLQYTCAGKKSV